MEKLNVARQSSIEKVVVGVKDVNLEEQKNLFKQSYSYLVRITHDEISGVDEDIVKNNDKLRKDFSKAADSTGMAKNMIPYEWLFAGIYDRIPNNKLKEWANLKEASGSNEKVKKVAEYLLNTKRHSKIK